MGTSDEKPSIILTLAQLKEYYKVWHENHFNDLHKTKVMDLIGSYLEERGLSAAVTNIYDIEKGIVTVIKYVSKMINGTSTLTDSSSLSEAIDELRNDKNINFASINLSSLYSKITSNETSINNLQNEVNNINRDKADVSYVDNITGKQPKQLQVQDIPINNNTNLNDYKTPGLYKSKNATITNGLSNQPIRDTAFSLMVIPHFDLGVRQILLAGEKNNNGNKIYTRNYNGGWSEWYELYGEHNTTPLQMQVEWSEGGSTTYTLLKR